MKSFLLLLLLAQKPDPFDLEVGSVILLQSKPVQKELKVTEAQRKAMNKFADSHKAKLESYQKELEKKQKDKTKALPVDVDRMDRMFADMKIGVIGQLSVGQVRRLREISLQQLGFVALTDRTVAKRVGLSDGDSSKLLKVYQAGIKEADEIGKTAQAQLRLQLADLERRKPKTDKEKKAVLDEAQKRAAVFAKKVDPQIQAVQIKTRDKVLGMLSAKQRRAWSALLGKPFKVS